VKNARLDLKAPRPRGAIYLTGIGANGFYRASDIGLSKKHARAS